jgi:Kef-type K+ transport system membrane component KefB
MSSADIGAFVITLVVFLAAVHLFGALFERLRQPRLIGEILAGILLGPFVLGYLAPEIATTLFGGAAAAKTGTALGFMYWLGMLLLMFIAGSGTRSFMAKENRGKTAVLLGIGTPLPFFITLTLGLTGILPIDMLVGSADNWTATLLVVCIGVAVTSIPVISRIFYDLGILHTRFASLVLGSAVIEDIILWGVLAISSALVNSAGAEAVVGDVTNHVVAAAIYMSFCIMVAPALLKRLHTARWNFLARQSPTAYAILILLAYCAVAAAFKINLVFAAFLAGFGLVGGMKGTQRQRFAPTLDAIASVATAAFIPIYFGMVGYKLVFGAEFSLVMLLCYMAGSSLLALIGVGIAARAAGFKGLDFINLAVVANARGGPGIVLASVAYELGIINGPFYTTLVLTAVFTSQIAGGWLRYVLSKNWPLLSSNPAETGLPEVRQMPEFVPGQVRPQAAGGLQPALLEAAPMH